MNSFYEASTDRVISEPTHLAKGDPSLGSDDPSLRLTRKKSPKIIGNGLKFSQTVVDCCISVLISSH